MTSVDALSGVGLAGDRYVEPKNRRSPDYEVTLIELENIEGFARATGLERAVFEGVELCEPCRLFAKRTYREVLDFFPGKGGLRARIVSGGILSVGDQVSWLRDER